jgi:hypothetical protein
MVGRARNGEVQAPARLHGLRRRRGELQRWRGRARSEESMRERELREEERKGVAVQFIENGREGERALGSSSGHQWCP